MDHNPFDRYDLLVVARIEVRTAEYKKEAAKLLGPENRTIVLEMRKELRVASKPVGDRILAAIGDAMPKAGGLAAKVRDQGRVSLLVDLRKGVKIQLANKLGMFMGQFEAGLVRHPDWGRWHRGTKPQSVPAGKGAAQFTKDAEALQRQVAEVVVRTARRVV